MITLRWNSQASTCKPFCTEQTGLHQVWDMDSQIHTPNGTKNAARSFPAQVWYIWESQTHTPNKACFFFGTWFFCLFFLVTCFFSFSYRSLLCFLNTVAQSHEKLWHCTGTFGCEKTMFPWQESHESDEISKTCVKFEEITWQNDFWKFTPLYSTILKTTSNSRNVGFKTKKPPHFSFFYELNFTDFTGELGSVLQAFCWSIAIPFNFIMAMGISMTPLWILPAGLRRGETCKRSACFLRKRRETTACVPRRKP